MTSTTPTRLAAAAVAGVPGLTPAASDVTRDDPDLLTARLQDAHGNWWLIRAARNLLGQQKLQAERRVLDGLRPVAQPRLTFLVPMVEGVSQYEGWDALVYAHTAGESLGLEVFDQAVPRPSHHPRHRRRPRRTGSPVDYALQIGKALASLHSLPESTGTAAQLRQYTAEQCREQFGEAIDRAAGVQKLPALVLRRWRHALEDDRLWGFAPTVVHGDLHDWNLVFAEGQLRTVIGWSRTHVSDPAQDFRWLLTLPDEDLAARVLTSYREAAEHEADPGILDRAGMYAEFAVVQELITAVQSGDKDRRKRAAKRLEEIIERDRAEVLSEIPVRTDVDYISPQR